MSPMPRRVLFLLAGAVLAFFLVPAIAALPPFGAAAEAYGRTLLSTAVAQRHATNVVASIMFDYRGLDTLGEEFVLFAAVVGVTLLLPAREGEEEAAREVERTSRGEFTASAAIRLGALGMLGFTALFGLYLVAHGHLTPGGGFQGAVVVASAWVLVYLADDFRILRRLTPEAWLEGGESVAGGGYVLVGLGGLLAGQAFLANFLGLGKPGHLLSAGTIALLNVVVGLEVTASFVLLGVLFLRQALVLRSGRQ